MKRLCVSVMTMRLRLLNACLMEENMAVIRVRVVAYRCPCPSITSFLRVRGGEKKKCLRVVEAAAEHRLAEDSI